MWRQVRPLAEKIDQREADPDDVNDETPMTRRIVRVTVARLSWISGPKTEAPVTLVLRPARVGIRPRADGTRGIERRGGSSRVPAPRCRCAISLDRSLVPTLVLQPLTLAWQASIASSHGQTLDRC